MDPDERTRRMKEEARREAYRHEQFSRANQGKPLPRAGLYAAIPLFTLVITLFTASYYYTKMRTNMIMKARSRVTEIAASELAREVQSLKEENMRLDKDAKQLDDQFRDDDIARWLDDRDKKWS